MSLLSSLSLPWSLSSLRWANIILINIKIINIMMFRQAIVRQRSSSRTCRARWERWCQKKQWWEWFGFQRERWLKWRLRPGSRAGGEECEEGLSDQEARWDRRQEPGNQCSCCHWFTQVSCDFSIDTLYFVFWICVLCLLPFCLCILASLNLYIAFQHQTKI